MAWLSNVIYTLDPFCMLIYVYTYVEDYRTMPILFIFWEWSHIELLEFCVYL